MSFQYTLDVISYAGEVNNNGYEALCDVLQHRQSQHALLVLATPGGDPHAGFRIARALQHTYESFDALVPRYCKSAGTLILTGASNLYLDDRSELGPLDIQVKKGDELIGRNSGLDIFQAVNYLQGQTLNAFRNYLVDLTQGHGLSTKVASDIAVNLTSGLFTPVSAQIDPIKLAEMQRATEVAIAYGTRLNEKSGNLRSDAIYRLVSSYPSHGFVIDRKEARTIFIRVKKPVGPVAELSEAMRASMAISIDSQQPVVKITSYGAGIGEVNDTSSSEPSHGSPESASSGHNQNHGSHKASESGSTLEPTTTETNAFESRRAANG